MVSKIILFWAHERIWIKIKWGKKAIEPFNYGSPAPLSGKSSIADSVYKKLNQDSILIQRIDSKLEK